MTKFKFNYQQNTFAYQTESDQVWYLIPEDKQFIRFNSQGFILEPANHWIQFTVYQKQIKVFYKQVQEPTNLDNFWTPETITYYRKYLPKQAEIIFELHPSDQIEKVADKWIKKGANYD